MIITELTDISNNINDIKLYDYQATIMANMVNFEYDNTDKLGFLNLPSGIGKTVITLALSKNNGISLFIVPSEMKINYIHRLRKYNISNITIFTTDELDNWINYDMDNIQENIIITTPEYYKKVLEDSNQLIFDRIIFDDTILDFNYLSILTNFTWVISADIDEYLNKFTIDKINNCTISLSVNMLNLYFKHLNVITTTIKCYDQHFNNTIKFEKENKNKILLGNVNDGDNEILKQYSNRINLLIYQVEPYNEKISQMLQLLKNKKKVVIYSEFNHNYLEMLIYKKLGLVYKTLQYEDYATLHNYNSEMLDGIIVNPNVKGITLIETKFVIIFDMIGKSLYENCIGRIIRKSRSPKLKLIVWKLEFGNI